jgi:hypothetical protein
MKLNQSGARLLSTLGLVALSLPIAFWCLQAFGAAGLHCTYEGRQDANHKFDSCLGSGCDFKPCTAIDMPKGYYCTSCTNVPYCSCSGTEVPAKIYYGDGQEDHGCYVDDGPDTCYCRYFGPPFDTTFTKCQ